MILHLKAKINLFRIWSCCISNQHGSGVKTFFSSESSHVAHKVIGNGAFKFEVQLKPLFTLSGPREKSITNMR